MRAEGPTKGPRAGSGRVSPPRHPDPTLSVAGPALAPDAATVRGGSACSLGGKRPASGIPCLSVSSPLGDAKTALSSRPAGEGLFLGTGRKWTPEVLAAIREALKTQNAKQIAHHLGVNDGAFRQAMARYRISLCGKDESGLTERRRQMIELRHQGKSYGAIAKALGIKPNSVAAHFSNMRRAGLI